jgi:hypothetical protein
MRLLTFFTILTLVTSCRQKFDSEKWKIMGDIRSFPHRDAMLDDIIENKKFIGLNYRQLIDSLGYPNGLKDTLIYYDIVTDYGLDIDPVYSKDLIIMFDKDSVIRGVKIKEWEK